MVTVFNLYIGGVLGTWLFLCIALAASSKLRDLNEATTNFGSLVVILAAILWPFLCWLVITDFFVSFQRRYVKK